MDIVYARFDHVFVRDDLDRKASGIYIGPSPRQDAFHQVALLDAAGVSYRIARPIDQINPALQQSAYRPGDQIETGDATDDNWCNGTIVADNSDGSYQVLLIDGRRAWLDTRPVHELFLLKPGAFILFSRTRKAEFEPGRLTSVATIDNRVFYIVEDQQGAQVPVRHKRICLDLTRLYPPKRSPPSSIDAPRPDDLPLSPEADLVGSDQASERPEPNHLPFLRRPARWPHAIAIIALIGALLILVARCSGN